MNYISLTDTCEFWISTLVWDKIFDEIVLFIIVSIYLSAYKNDVRFVFTSSSLYDDECLYVICVCLRLVVSNTCCVMFLFCFSLSCVPYVAGFSGLSCLIAPSVFSNVYVMSMFCRSLFFFRPLCCLFFWLPLWYSLFL